MSMSEHSYPNPPSRPSDDSVPLQHIALDQIDQAKVTEHITGAIARGRYNGPSDPMHYLIHSHCASFIEDVLHPTLAGVLCFGRTPQAYYPRAVVDLGHYRGSEVVSFEVVHLERGVGGTLFNQIDRVERYLWQNIQHGMTIAEQSARRVDLHQYPQVVLRELVVNLLAHRDYSNTMSAARVQIFRNRVEWISPGSLAPGVTVDNILTAQASRNPAILSVLYEAGYVEAFGQGLDTVVSVLRRENLPPPRFDDMGGFFVVTVAGHPLELFTSDMIGARLSERQRRILALVRVQGETTPQDIVDMLNNRVTMRSIQRDLKELIVLGLLIADGKGRAVRYRMYDAPF